MDDYNIQSLTDSRNAYTQIFVEKLCPVIIQGFDSIYQDSMKICIDNDEEDKYLMTFQNFLARVPKWNQSIITTEVNRIKEETNCGYLEDLLTCVHVTQLKLLTNIRVGNNQKKISIQIPDLNSFIHNVYIECARKIYKNVYLFENIDLPIQKQKYKRELELLIQTSILITIRNNMPIESILKAYLDESIEHEVFDKVEEFEEEIEEKVNNDEIDIPNEQILAQTPNLDINTTNVEDNLKNDVVLDKYTEDTPLEETLNNNTNIQENVPVINAPIIKEPVKNEEISQPTNNDSIQNNVKFIGDDVQFESEYFTDEDSDFGTYQNNIQIFDHDKDLDDVTDLTPNKQPENDLTNLLDIEEL